VAACYGPLREVEVLHDFCWIVFKRHIIVAFRCSYSDTGYRHVWPPGAVGFRNAKQLCGVSMPFTIADQSVLSENVVAKFAQDILSAFLDVLNSRDTSLFERTSELSGCRSV